MENENDIVAKRTEAVEELKAALAELEGGEERTELPFASRKVRQVC